MALDNIEKLIEKYFDAETTLAEEKELKAYFSSDTVAPPLEQYKPIFGYTAQAKHEQFTGTIPLKAKKSHTVLWLSVAASVVVLLGVGFFTFNHYNQPVSEDFGTYDDPEVAFRETQKALEMISQSVNEGIESMDYLNEYEQSKNTIFK
jgi:sensor histidine kinase YesM